MEIGDTVQIRAAGGIYEGRIVEITPIESAAGHKAKSVVLHNNPRNFFDWEVTHVNGRKLTKGVLCDDESEKRLYRNLLIGYTIISAGMIIAALIHTFGR